MTRLSDPIAMEVLLHHVLNAEQNARLRNTSPLRYVDNLTYLVSDVSEGWRILEEARTLLARVGFQLKGEDGEPRDLRDSGFDRKVLGLVPRWAHGQLGFSIPESAFDDLATGLRLAYETRRPADNALRCCRSWIGQVAPALTNAVRPQVASRVVGMAREAGFRSITPGDVLRAAESAVRAWHVILRENQQ